MSAYSIYPYNAEPMVDSWPSFAGTVRLHSLLLRTSTTSTAPRTLKLFLNKSGMDFSAAADTPPTQTLVLSQTAEVQEVPVKRALFSNTYSLTLFVEDNYGDGEEDVSEVFYLGFKGEFLRLSREAVEVSYESAANPRDHTAIVGIRDGGLGSGLGRGE